MLVQTSARSEGGGRYVAHVVFPMAGSYELQLIVAGSSGVGSLRVELDVSS